PSAGHCRQTPGRPMGQAQVHTRRLATSQLFDLHPHQGGKSPEAVRSGASRARLANRAPRSGDTGARSPHGSTPPARPRFAPPQGTWPWPEASGPAAPHGARFDRLLPSFAIGPCPLGTTRSAEVGVSSYVALLQFFQTKIPRLQPKTTTLKNLSNGPL